MTNPNTSQRIADTIEWLAKVGGSIAILWGFVAKIWVPILKWRDKHLATTIRECLAPELAHIKDLMDTDTGWMIRATRFEKRIEELYDAQSKLLDIAIDNQDRHNETNDLLDALGFTTDRRSQDDRRKQAQELVADLERRRRDRRKPSAE